MTRASPALRIFSAGSLASALAFTSACNDPSLTPLQLGIAAPPPPTVSFVVSAYTPTPGRQFKDYFVSNFSVKVFNGTLQYSTSRDSLSDTLKTAHNADYGFFPTTPESNPSAHFADLLLWLAGVPIINQNTLFCAPSLMSASAGDAFVYSDTRLPGSPLTFLGLRDCEKQYMGLNPQRFDFDGDGIPDYLEMRAGMNPQNPNDATLSAAADGMSNIDKVKHHIPTDEPSTTQANTTFAYNYNIQLSPNDGSRIFTVSNIPIMNGGQDNFIAFYLTEVDPTTNLTYLFTAYTILANGVAGTTLKFPFWYTATNGNLMQNQEITF